MQFQLRSYEKEFLDNDVIATKDLYQTLVELDVINKYLGGYKASLKGLKDILKGKRSVHTILDIGFGGGDFIKQFSRFSDRKNIPLFFYGVDMKSDCIRYAETNLAMLNNTRMICDDYRNIDTDLLEKIDVIHCSLFLHHLNDAEIIELFRFSREHGCMILANDLHRHWLAYYSIKFLTALFSRSWLVKNDACLSVRRAFKKSELESMLQQAGYKNYSVKWSWAFRYIITAFE
ncbi:MAG: methyltransferase domain-containing protein [Chitinophagaceae bacterium]|nr:methyltransferase domain-containing protein [Chitinophagaceae bacterium]